MADAEINTIAAKAYVPLSKELADDYRSLGADLNALMTPDPNCVPPKPWEGEPLTPKPEAYQRLLAAATDPLVRELVELHGPVPQWVQPDGTVTSWVCRGCEFSGYEADPPNWPCETSAVIAQRLGVSANGDMA